MAPVGPRGGLDDHHRGHIAPAAFAGGGNGPHTEVVVFPTGEARKQDALRVGKDPGIHPRTRSGVQRVFQLVGVGILDRFAFEQGLTRCAGGLYPQVIRYGRGAFAANGFLFKVVTRLCQLRANNLSVS